MPEIEDKSLAKDAEHEPITLMVSLPADMMYCFVSDLLSREGKDNESSLLRKIICSYYGMDCSEYVPQRKLRSNFKQSKLYRWYERYGLEKSANLHVRFGEHMANLGIRLESVQKSKYFRTPKDVWSLQVIIERIHEIAKEICKGDIYKYSQYHDAHLKNNIYYSTAISYIKESFAHFGMTGRICSENFEYFEKTGKCIVEY